MSGLETSGEVGYPGVKSDGTNPALRQGRGAQLMTQDTHARYFEAIRLGTAFVISTAAAGVALAAANASVVAATAQPIVGLLNPAGSGVHLSVLEALYGVQATGASAANEGIPVWQYCNFGASTAPLTNSATSPTALKTLTASGSKADGLLNQPLTGNTITWVQLKPFGGTGGGGPRMTAPTASINVNTLARDETAGLILVPPGFALGLFVLAAGTTITVASSITYEEIASGLVT